MKKSISFLCSALILSASVPVMAQSSAGTQAVTPRATTGDKVALDIVAIGGHVVGADYSGVPETIDYGKSVSLLPLAPANGYVLKSLTVRHGQQLDGPQYDGTVRQWSEYTVDGAAADKEFTIPADSVDGDVRVTARFEADGTETYKLLFADEFNTADGTLPDATYWTRCSRESPTWKRFTSQTAEGQALTGFVRDGKLVMRCVANDIDDEGDVDMISGAVESSSKMYFAYGRVEARLRTTPHRGNFPAFWLMPEDNSAGWPNAGEIDIWEQIDTENKTYHTVHTHCTYDLGLAKPNSGSAWTDAAEWHVISLVWTPTLLTWYVDGIQAFTYAKSSDETLLEKGQWPFDKPFYIILNQSVGNGSWAANCDTSFDYETLFDYVRVYQSNDSSAVLYPVNYDEAATISRTDRYTSSISLVSGDGTQTVAVDQQTSKKLYFDRLDNCFLAQPGETVTPKVGFTGVWMAGYAYIDKDNDGNFDVTYTDDGITDQGDLMSYSLFKNYTSTGTYVSGSPDSNPPAFTIPADLAPGIYRMRYKVDWDNVDPGGNPGPSNKITDNGGVIVDTRINVHGTTVSLSCTADGLGGGLNGDILLADGTPVSGQTAPFGEALTVKAAPASGYQLSHVLIRHGYNLEKDSMVCKNLQWQEVRVDASAFTDNAYTLPASMVDGDVRFVPYFISDEQTGIVETETSGEKPTVTAVYGIAGERRNAPGRGVNVLKMSDGGVKKIVVK